MCTIDYCILFSTAQQSNNSYDDLCKFICIYTPTFDPLFPECVCILASNFKDDENKIGLAIYVAK